MTRRAPGPQPLSALKAESRRPYYGPLILAERGVGAGLRQRAEITLRDLAPLAEAGVAFSPFLEIGAGSTQRSAALMNRYGAEGAATDISLDQLRNGPYVLALLGYERGPLLVSCDAAHLPFQESTFQFAFCCRSASRPQPGPRGGGIVPGAGRAGISAERRAHGQPVETAHAGRPSPVTSAHRVQRIATRLGVARLFWDDSGRGTGAGDGRGAFRSLALARGPQAVRGGARRISRLQRSDLTGRAWRRLSQACGAATSGPLPQDEERWLRCAWTSASA